MAQELQKMQDFVRDHATQLSDFESALEETIRCTTVWSLLYVERRSCC